MRALDQVFLLVNAIRNRFVHKRYPARNILLLLPRCLQNHDCDVRMNEDLFKCKGCGRCKMKDLKALAERLGVHAFVATGGRAAAKRALANDIQAVVAVACRRELAEGVRAVFPRRVVGVSNSWPHGECHDTDVQVADVEAALVDLIEADGRETADRHE